jgi:hypothetical protein
MSANIELKNLKTKKVNSSNKSNRKVLETSKNEVLQLLVEKYEYAYYKFYLMNLTLRLALTITLMFSFLFVFFIQKYSWELIEKYTFILSIIIGLFSFIIASTTSRGSALFSIIAALTGSKDNINDFREETSDLEDKIVKEKLKESFDLKPELKNKIEDFYIELHSLTKAKYETALRFQRYESFFYLFIGTAIFAAAIVFTVFM